jgi:hypothetical protein
LRRAGGILEGLIPVAAALLAFAFWRSPVLYPLKIFVVLLHEISHGLAAILTGGSIVSIHLGADEGGVCLTRGGSRFVILSAGYLGSLCFGSLLVLVAARSRRDRVVVACLGFALVAVTLFFVRTLFGFAYGLVAGVALLLAARKLPEPVSDAILKVLGAVSCLYAVWDIASDVLLRDVPGSDASALARLTGVPASLWGLLWIGLALTVTAVTFWKAVRVR